MSNWSLNNYPFGALVTMNTPVCSQETRGWSQGTPAWSQGTPAWSLHASNTPQEWYTLHNTPLDTLCDVACDMRSVFDDKKPLPYVPISGPAIIKDERTIYQYADHCEWFYCPAEKAFYLKKKPLRLQDIRTLAAYKAFDLVQDPRIPNRWCFDPNVYAL